MGKHEPMTAKAIANKIKAKGLQKIKYYCEMCKKQCRDDNGFKCHIMSESHQRQALIVSENPDQFVNEFSKKFTDDFMYILRARYKTKRVLANTVFQEQIKDREHIHMNATRWTSLTEFAHWLGENGLVKVDESERGVMVTYIDRDPETLRRLEVEAKRTEQAKEAAVKEQQRIERQIEATKEYYKETKTERPPAQPVPMIKVVIESGTKPKTEDDSKNTDDCANTIPEMPDEATTSYTKLSVQDETLVMERPLFSVKPMSLKSAAGSCYKPPKRKVMKKLDVKKKIKST